MKPCREEEPFGCKYRKGFEHMSLAKAEVLVQLLRIAAMAEAEAVDK